MSSMKRSSSRDRGTVAQKKFQVQVEDLDRFTNCIAMYNQTHPLDKIEVSSSTVVDSVLKFKMSFDQVTSIVELQSKLRQLIYREDFDFGVHGNRLVATTPYENWAVSKSNNPTLLMLLIVGFIFALLVYIEANYGFRFK
jgi:hypothetical protein